jgi:hypothetical protein
MKSKPQSLKFYRSPVGKGMNLGTRVEKQGKGKGAYVRREKHGNRWED